MALTLESEQRLTDVGLVAFFERHQAAWLTSAQEIKNFCTKNFPAGAKIRRDDVAKAFFTVLEVHEDFKEFRETEKLRGKFWIKDFADLIIDRTWDELQ
jgi:hypothetical protein